MRRIRPAAVAGLFYPGGPGELAHAVDRLIDTASALYKRTAPKKDPGLSGPNGLSLRVEPLRLGAAASPSAHEPIERNR